MGGIAIDIERALAFELRVALAAEATFPVAAGAVTQCVLGAALHADINAFSILNVDGRSRGIGQRESIESDGGFQRAIHVEPTVGAGTRERIGDFVC